MGFKIRQLMTGKTQEGEKTEVTGSSEIYITSLLWLTLKALVVCYVDLRTQQIQFNVLGG